MLILPWDLTLQPPVPILRTLLSLWFQTTRSYHSVKDKTFRKVMTISKVLVIIITRERLQRVFHTFVGSWVISVIADHLANEIKQGPYYVKVHEDCPKHCFKNEWTLTSALDMVMIFLKILSFYTVVYDRVVWNQRESRVRLGQEAAGSGPKGGSA